MQIRFPWRTRPGDVLQTTGEPSPDGRYLAGVDWGTTASNIAVLDLVTGESRQLTDHPDFEEGMALSAGFSPDGNTIAYSWFDADEESAEVRLAFRAFDTVPKVEPWQDGGSLSPDDRYLAFDFGVAKDSDRRDISMIPTDVGAEITVVEHPANDRVVGWVPGTNDFLFVSDRGGKSDCPPDGRYLTYWNKRDRPKTGEATELLRFPSLRNWYWEHGAAQAPNGRDIVYVREGRLVLHEVASGEETEVYRHPGGEVEELLAVDLAQGTRIRNVHWGSDGRYVYFTDPAGDKGTVLKRASFVAPFGAQERRPLQECLAQSGRALIFPSRIVTSREV